MEEISLFLAREFSQTKCRIVEVGHQTAWIDHEIGEAELATEEQCLALVLWRYGRSALRSPP